MSKLEERVLIYTAVAVLCAFTGVFVGLWGAAMTFVQIAAVIEALFWFGIPRPGRFRFRSRRQLFN